MDDDKVTRTYSLFRNNSTSSAHKNASFFVYVKIPFNTCSNEAHETVMKCLVQESNSEFEKHTQKLMDQQFNQKQQLQQFTQRNTKSSQYTTRGNFDLEPSVVEMISFFPLINDQSNHWRSRNRALAVQSLYDLMKKLQDNRIDVSSFVDNFCLVLGDENITVDHVKANYLLLTQEYSVSLWETTFELCRETDWL